MSANTQNNMLINLPMDMVINVVTYMHADQANNFLLYSTNQQTKSESDMVIEQLQKKIKSGQLMRQLIWNNRQYFEEACEDPAMSFHNENDMVNALSIYFSSPYLHTTGHELKSGRPKVWDFKRGGLVDSVYHCKLGTWFKIRSRPTVAALAY